MKEKILKHGVMVGLKKLQDDMKDSKSDVGIIFTKALPKEFPKTNCGITKEIFLYVNIIS